MSGMNCLLNPYRSTHSRQSKGWRALLLKFQNLIMAILTIKVQLEVEIEVPDRKVMSFIEEDMEDMVVNSIAINECRPDWDENHICQLQELHSETISQREGFANDAEVTLVTKDNGKEYKWNGSKLVLQKGS